MRVLHVDAGNLYGGVETFLVTLARLRELSPALQPEFAVCFEGRVADELRTAGVPVHMMDEVRFRWPLTVMRARRRLRALLSAGRFDGVFCHGPWPQAVFGPAVRSCGVPLVFWLHNPAEGGHWLTRVAALTPPDLAICNSDFTAGSLANLYPSVPTRTLYYPVILPTPADSQAVRSGLRGEFDTPLDATVIVQTSRMEPWKGHELHLRALAMLRDVPGWVCWQVGGAQRATEARYLDSLKRLAGELDIRERVRFLGERSDVGRLLCAADVHCQPNAGPEPFGITFVEALYAGLPVVTTALGGAREIVDESCGILTPSGDAAALAAALGRLVVSRELRVRLGSNGPARARALCDPATQMARLGESISALVRVRGGDRAKGSWLGIA